MSRSLTNRQVAARALHRPQPRRLDTVLRLAIGLGAVATFLSDRPLHAQAGTRDGSIAGVVRDSAGIGIAGAQLRVAGTVVRAVTDNRGGFRLTAVRSGTAAVHVRRLGFRPVIVEVLVQPGRTTAVDLILPSAAQELAPVVVRRGERQYIGPFAEFNRRRAAGFGHFITRDQIDRWELGRLTEVLRRVPSVRILTDEFGKTGVRLRGTVCAPLIWVDGTPAGIAEFDLDAIPLQTLEGIEVYSDAATVPLELRSPQGPGGCGAIAVWSRHGERRRPRSHGRFAAAESRSTPDTRVYTSEQVDVPAWVDPAAPIRPAYPGSLYRSGVAGKVIAMFVVDTTGRAEIDTFVALLSAHPLFTDAVRRALGAARFVPAVREGHRVRQLVRLPFRFVVPRRGS